jgi:GTP-binding protein
MLGTILEANPFSAASSPAASHPGTVKPNQAVKVLSRDGKLLENGRVSKILAFRGLERQPIDEAEAGDIVAIAGLTKGTVADTFCDPTVDRTDAGPADRSADRHHVLHRQRLAARRHRRRQGHQPRHPRPPAAEAEGNVALKIEEAGRQGFVLRFGPRRIAARGPDRDHAPRRLRAAVSRPRVVLQKDENGEILEPIEEVVIDVDEEHSGVVVQKMSERKAEMVEMRPSGGNRQRLVFHAPTRGLIGYQSSF